LLTSTVIVAGDVATARTGASEESVPAACGARFPAHDLDPNLEQLQHRSLYGLIRGL
jgi:hypothetical protein